MIAQYYRNYNRFQQKNDIFCPSPTVCQSAGSVRSTPRRPIPPSHLSSTHLPPPCGKQKAPRVAGYGIAVGVYFASCHHSRYAFICTRCVSSIKNGRGDPLPFFYLICLIKEGICRALRSLQRWSLWGYRGGKRLRMRTLRGTVRPRALRSP